LNIETAINRLKLLSHSERLQLIFSISASILLGLACLIFSIISFTKGLYLNGFLVLISSIACLTAGVIFFFKSDSKHSKWIICTVALSVGVYLFYSGGTYAVGIIWSPVAPLLVFLVANLKEGIVLTAVHITTLSVLYITSVVSPNLINLPDYTHGLILTSLIIYIVQALLIITYKYGQTIDRMHLIKKSIYAQEMAEKAKQASVAKSSFLANMSHEIRTPLNGIIGYTEIMLGTEHLEVCHEQANIILRQSEHLLGIINDILDQAKIEAGKIELEKIPLDLKDLVEVVVSISNVKAEEKKIDLNVIIGYDVYQYIFGDPLRLRQVILNLVSNAIKFTEKGFVSIKIDKISLDKELKKQRLKFTVEDSGIGISKEGLLKIFDKFAQADDSTTRKFGGTGLGTSIAKSFVELMGGNILVESELNKGSRFFFEIEFPICNEEDIDKQLQINFNLDVQADYIKAKILVAEDYPVNQQVAKQHLESAGHEVVIADNGMIAFEMCKKEYFDLILMDIQMPELDGYAATRRIKEVCHLCKDTPVIGLTANVDEASRKSCFDAGMSDVASKPIRKKVLLAIVNKWLTARQSDSVLNTEDREVTIENLSAPINIEEGVEEFGDREGFLGVVKQLIENVGEQIEIMTLAIQEKNFEKITKNAHSIKGGAATVEAMDLSNAAKKIEELGKAANLESVPKAFETMIKEFDRLKTFIDKI